MIFSFKLIVTIALFLLGGASIFVGYKKWGWIMKMVFGKERVQSKGTSTISFYMYIIGAILILLGILIIT